MFDHQKETCKSKYQDLRKFRFHIVIEYGNQYIKESLSKNKTG